MTNTYRKDPGKPVYHGSPHGFNPGDTVNPTQDFTHMRGGRAAFGTVFPETAGYFGLRQAQESIPRSPQGRQGQLFSSVYEVGPKSAYELHPSIQNDHEKAEEKVNKPHQLGRATGAAEILGQENNMPIDREGFEVQSHHGFAYPNLADQAKGYLTEDIQKTPKGVGGVRSQ